MMRSLFAGVSALRNHQVKMDVIGNNIANVNTIGYKAATVTFKEQLSQTMKGAGAPQGGRGGTNPQQIGLGVDLGAITNIHTPGNLQSTGVESDVAIEGNGFFILSDGANQYFTRAGAFDFDESGSLSSLSHGLSVMGYSARNGVVDVAGGLVPVRIPVNQTIAPRPTTTTDVTGNLDARLNGTIDFDPNPMTLSDGVTQAQVSVVLTPTGNFNEWTWQVQTPGGVTSAGQGIIRLDANGNVVDFQDLVPGTVTVGTETFTLAMPVGGPPSFSWTGTTVPATIANGTFTPPAVAQTSIRVFDSRGEQHDVIISFEKVDENAWTWAAADKLGNSLGGGSLTYNTAGALLAQTGQISFNPPGADPVVIDPDFQALTQYSEDADVSKVRQNGFPAGTLTTISVDTAGRVNGSFSNGLSQTLAQIALADFSNPAGLVKAAGTLFQVSPNSGQPDIGLANSGARGAVSPGSLEMSNVDLSLEFTNMIITQRGFQANSRIITTSDEMLQELVNLKR